MIFSDLYVRFYSEAFRFVDAQGEGELEKFFAAISRNVLSRVRECFMTKGMKGMEEYWGNIRKEENCDSSTTLEDGVLSLRMARCPSLSKVLDSDAVPCPKYCRHCPGWVLPVMTQCGFYCVYDAVAPDVPQCRSFITESGARAEVIRRKLLAEGAAPAWLFSNLDQAEEVEANRLRRLAMQRRVSGGATSAQ